MTVTKKTITKLKEKNMNTEQTSTEASEIFNTKTAQEIMETNYPAVRFFVEGMLTEGLCLLVGAPKTGKSWFALQLAIAVSQGNNFLGQLETKQSDVVYFALEDPERRLKSRLIEVLDDETELERLYFSTELASLKGGLCEKLKQYIEQHPEKKCFIIDTLGRIDKEASKNDEYTRITNDLGELQEFAVKNNILLVLIHHTRKNKSDTDVFDNILGSTGLNGVADTMLVLERERNGDSGTLNVTGRDIEERKYFMKLTEVTWHLTEAPPVILRPTKQTILDCLKASQEPLTPNDISKATEINYDNVRQTLSRMVKEELLKKDAGKYSVTPSQNDETPSSSIDTTVTPDVTNTVIEEEINEESEEKNDD